MTFIEKYTKALTKEKERMIVKSLSYARPNNKVRKNSVGWTISTITGKYYVEFSESADLLYFADYGVDSISNKEYTSYSHYLYVYKDKNGAPIKEVSVKDFLDDAIRYHKLLTN
jgi:hypothetical protein